MENKEKESTADNQGAVSGRVESISVSVTANWKSGFPIRDGFYICRKLSNGETSLYYFQSEDAKEGKTPWLHLSGWYDSSEFHWLDMDLNIPTTTSSKRHGWTDCAEKLPPQDGSPVEVLTATSMRFKLYAPYSEQFKRGILGRWQEINEVGGWENTSREITFWRDKDVTS